MMAEGAYSPHARKLNLTLELNKKEGATVPTPEMLNPYTATRKAKEAAAEGSEGVFAMKAMLPTGTSVHNVGAVPLPTTRRNEDRDGNTN